MEQSPFPEANSHSASQIPRPSWNPKFHYLVHNSPSLVPTMSQMYPVHTFPPYSPNTHPNIIFPSTSRSYEWFLRFTFSDQNLYAFLMYPMCTTCPDHFIITVKYSGKPPSTPRCRKWSLFLHLSKQLFPIACNSASYEVRPV
jgi:hypothetical protein